MAAQGPTNPAPQPQRRVGLSGYAAALASVLDELVRLKRPVTAAAVAALIVSVVGNRLGAHIDATEVSSALVLIGGAAGVIEKALER